VDVEVVEMKRRRSCCGVLEPAMVGGALLKKRVIGVPEEARTATILTMMPGLVSGFDMTDQTLEKEVRD
jgi:hypothetical protein